MRKTLKWVALFVVMLPVHLILVLAVTGVARPPAITAEGVGRVAWGPVLDDAARLWESRERTIRACPWVSRDRSSSAYSTTVSMSPIWKAPTKDTAFATRGIRSMPG